MAETSLQDIVALARQWLTPGGLAVVIGFVWRASARNTDLAKTQRDHGERIAEQRKDIDALKTADSDRKVAIAGMPSREDMRELREEIRTANAETREEMRSGFENLTRLVRRD